jgi:hypothetical protein
MSTNPLADNVFLAEFLVQKPLCVKTPATFPEHATSLLVDRIVTRCPCCKSERPFTDQRSRGGGAGMPTPKTRSGIFAYPFRCVICSQELRCWVQVNIEEGWLRKVGQMPPWSIEISRTVAEALGADAELYKKALISLSQGYGLGACAYLRRVVENNVNRILALLLELNRELGASPEKLRALQAVIDSKVAARKLAEASKFLPPSLIVSGVNPLRLLYDSLSQGIHSMTETECADTGAQIVSALEYLVTELDRQLTARQHFAGEVRRLAANRPDRNAQPSRSRRRRGRRD